MPEPTDGQKKAIRKAMQLLEYRDRSVKELAERLKKAGFAPDEVEAALEYVHSFGYLNDERYASTYIYGRMTQKSRRRILTELTQKGIDRETAEAAWQETAAHYDLDERAILRETVLRRVPQESVLTDKKFRSLMGYLVRRGFAYEDIQAVLRELSITQEPRHYGDTED